MRIIQSKIIILLLNKNIVCDYLGKTVLMRGHNVCLYGKLRQIIPTLSSYPFLTGAHSTYRWQCMLSICVSSDNSAIIHDVAILRWTLRAAKICTCKFKS